MNDKKDINDDTNVCKLVRCLLFIDSSTEIEKNALPSPGENVKIVPAVIFSSRSVSTREFSLRPTIKQLAEFHTKNRQ